MNFRRGFRRLFLVATIIWYVLGGGVVAVLWSTHFDRVAEQRKSLAQCLAAEDENGKPIVVPKGYHLDILNCGKSWPPVDATDEWLWSIGVAVAPWFAYGAGKVLAWIGRGFRTETPGPV